MKYPWIDEYLLSMPSVTKDLQSDWNWIRYKIGGKMFVAICLDQNDRPYYINLKLEPAEGTFEIGLKILKNDGARQVRVHWTALRNEIRKPESAKKKHIFIQPDNPNVFVGDSVVFTAVLEGFTDERLKWTVRDSEGGTIDKNGKYTAPETAGIFHITVSSMAYPKVQASTFVVVREKE